MDAITNFAYSTVATAPSPATTGTSLILAAGGGALFPQPSTDGAFNIVVWVTGVKPLSSNAEICRVTARATDTLTITRQQEGTSARTVVVGDQVMLAPTKKTFDDIQAGNNIYAADAGANDTYVVTLYPVPPAYVTGMVVRFKANTINTGAATLNVNGLGAKTIVKDYNLTLDNGDIKANQLVEVIYDGTNFQLLSPIALKSKVLEATRDVSVATGSVAYTGVGFTPTAIICISTINSNANSFNIGIADSALTDAGLYADGTSRNIGGDLVTLVTTSGNSQNGALSSFDADGFTISYVKYGTPTGIGLLRFLCFR